MLRIKSPFKFIKSIIVLDFVLAIVFILLGIITGLDLISRILQNRGHFGYPIQQSIIAIGFIIAGIIALISRNLIKKSKYSGIKLNKVTFIILCGIFLLILINLIIFDLSRNLSGLHYLVSALNAFMSTIIFLVFLLIVLKLYKNKDILKDYFLIKTCYNCKMELERSQAYCPNCGVKQRSKSM